MRRFIDTDLWLKPWFRKLKPCEKAAWVYLTTRCDNVGVWTPDFEIADIFIGEPVAWDKFVEKCNGNIYVMPNNKWWLVSFCEFQHTDLDPESNSKPIRSYIALLKKHNLWITYTKGMDNFQGKGKGKGKGTEREREGERFGEVVKMEADKYETLCFQYGKKEVDNKIDDINNYCLSKGKRYKDYAATVRAWFKKDGVMPRSGEVKRCPNGHLYTGDVCERCI